MKILLFVTKPYSFSILEPVQNAAAESGHSVKWFTAGSARDIIPPGERLQTSQNVKDYNPDAVIVPGNVVPDFWPGLKVQVFHGLGEEKKGHYRITNFFDLYCTPGPYMTEKFNILAEKYQNFLVRETGWPKMDNLNPENQHLRKEELGFSKSDYVILYAPTFSPRYTSTIALFPEIKQLVQDEQYYWLVKFHPLMEQKLMNEYKELANKQLSIVADNNINLFMEVSDLLITDTSSAAYEYLLLDRPIITFNATARKNKGININDPTNLLLSIKQSIAKPEKFHIQRKKYLDELHPFTDGKSAERIIKTIEEIQHSEIFKKLKPKSPNWIQKRQIRKIVT